MSETDNGHEPAKTVSLYQIEDDGSTTYLGELEAGQVTLNTDPLHVVDIRWPGVRD